MAFSAVEEGAKGILPKECYPPTSESDDEESFVVLSRSLPPDSLMHIPVEGAESVKTSVIRESLELTNSILHSLSVAGDSALPSLPKTDKDGENTTAFNVGAASITTTLSSADLTPEEIQQKVDSLIEENTKLKETLLQNNLAMKKQYDTLVMWQEDVLKVHESHKQKFAETKEYIEKLKSENAGLKEELTECTKKNEQLEEKMKEIQENLNQKNEKQKEELLKSSFDNVKQFELEAAQKKVSSLEARVAKLQAENDELKKSVNESMTHSEKEVDDLKKQLTEANNLIEKMKLDIDAQTRNHALTISKLLDENKLLKEGAGKQGDKNIMEAHAKALEQLAAAQMHITNLETLRNQYLETINNKEEEMNQLKSSLKDVTDSDTVAALRTQLELYKADFDAEQQQRQELKAEKDQIADDLHHLQRRNQQLLEEVERLRKGGFVVIEGNDSSSSRIAPSAPNDDTDNPFKFACPKCNFKFRDYQSLENHVYRCIEVDNFP